jgi:uncharacterized protein (TIGR03067 family)
MLRRTICLLGVVAICLSAKGNPTPKSTTSDLVKAELAKLEGTWKAVSCRRDGKEWPAEKVAQKSSLTFKGSSYCFSSGAKGRITMIDPTATPKTINYLNDDDDSEEGVQRAIYKLEGDTFIDCIVWGYNARPKDFASMEGSGHILVKYKRAPEKQN